MSKHKKKKQSEIGFNTVHCNCSFYTDMNGATFQMKNSGFFMVTSRWHLRNWVETMQFNYCPICGAKKGLVEPWK